ncbi:MAG: TolC family protein [Calditrichaeota bacterium]|nr:MAG: TolC family protein [Calditrichota bacterium]
MQSFVLLAIMVFASGCFIVTDSNAQTSSGAVKHISMQEAIARALHKNNQIRANQYAVRKAGWDRKNAWSQLLPDISLNSRYTWIDDSTYVLRDFFRQNIRLFFPNIPESVEIPQTVFQTSYFSSVDISAPLFNAAILNGLFIANANVRMAEEYGTSMKDNITFQVVSSYLNVLKGLDVLKLQHDYLELSQLNYEKAERLFGAGRYSKTEALRWKVEYQQQKSQVATSRTVLHTNQSLLRRLLNMDLQEEIEIVDQIPAQIKNESDRIAILTEDALLKMVQLSDDALISANAALAAGRANEDISRLLYKNSYAAYLPQVTASYSHSWQENNTFALDDYSPKVFSINLSVPLFTGFKNLTSVKSAYYEHKKTEELFQDQLKNIRHILTEIINRLMDLRTLRELTKVEVEYNEHNYKVVAQQKERDLVSNIEFIDAKLNAQNARLNAINAEYDFISSMVELYYLLGRLGAIVE